MKDQHCDYFQQESRIPQINRAPHNNASPTPQDVRGDSGMDPSMDPGSSRAHGTETKIYRERLFFLSPQSYTCFILFIYKISHKQLGGFLFH